MASLPRPYKAGRVDPPLSRVAIHSYPDVMRTKPWLAISRDLTLLGFESAEVMLRRSLKLARGGTAAVTEFHGMVAEKAEATAELQYRLLTGQLSPGKPAALRAAIGHVRRKVRANRNRLRK